MDRRPPLAVSPRRLRTRRILRSDMSSRSPPAVSASLRETQIPIFASMAPDKSPLRPDFEVISHELQVLARRAKEQFGDGDGRLGPSSFASQLTQISSSSPMFERGRRYDLYTARRNERLRGRKREAAAAEAEEKRAHGLGVVNTEMGKKRAAARRADSVRKSVPADFSVPQRRSLSYASSYSLRSSVKSSQEFKKAMSSFATPMKSSVVGATEKKAAVRSSCRRN